jgi:hypothetical protein
LAALEGQDVTEQERKLREQWAEDVEDAAVAAGAAHLPRLASLSAPYRRIRAPLLKLISDLQNKNPDRTIAVLIPELVKRHWWEYLLSNQRARQLRNAVLEYGRSTGRRRRGAVASEAAEACGSADRGRNGGTDAPSQCALLSAAEQEKRCPSRRRLRQTVSKYFTELIWSSGRRKTASPIVPIRASLADSRRQRSMEILNG